MSQQQQTVRITTTETTSSSALVINSGYLATPPGLLKLAQFVNIVQSIVITMKKKLSFVNYKFHYVYIRMCNRFWGAFVSE